MSSSWITNLLPFWILGVPLVVAIVNYLRMPGQRDLAPPDRREDRRNIVGETAIRAGDTAVTRG